MPTTETGHAPNRAYFDQDQNLHLNGAKIYADESGGELGGTEVALLDGLTAGAVTASKALVVDANRDLGVAAATAVRNMLVTNLDAGISGTAGTVDVFPTTASRGKLQITCTDQTGDTTVTLTAGAMAAARTITIPDPGAAADIVVTAGTQTVGGAKSFSSAITPTAGVAAAAGSSAGPAGMIHTGGSPASAATDGVELTPTTTTVYTVEIFIPCNMTVTGVRVFNGGAVDGNITVGLYTAAGVAIGAALSAATAGSGTDAYQSIPFAAPYAAVGPAKYLIGFQYSNGAHRPNCHVIGTAFGIAQASATVGVTAISPLPTEFVTATQPIASLY